VLKKQTLIMLLSMAELLAEWQRDGVHNRGLAAAPPIA
jgi:hypothetical protein